MFVYGGASFVRRRPHPGRISVRLVSEAHPTELLLSAGPAKPGKLRPAQRFVGFRIVLDVVVHGTMDMKIYVVRLEHLERGFDQGFLGCLGNRRENARIAFVAGWPAELRDPNVLRWLARVDQRVS